MTSFLRLTVLSVEYSGTASKLINNTQYRDTVYQ